MWMLAEMQTPHVQIEVGGPFGGLDAPEFLRLNPNARVPVIQHSGVVVWESHAILRYLARRFGRIDLYPTDPSLAALVDMWMDWHITTFWPPVRIIFLSHYRSAELGWDDANIQKARQDLTSAFAVLASRLEDAGSAAGHSMTLADIPLAVGIGRLKTMALDLEIPSTIETWWRALSARPAYNGVRLAEAGIRRG
jgi:glutathione S-transferase